MPLHSWKRRTIYCSRSLWIHLPRMMKSGCRKAQCSESTMNAEENEDTMVKLRPQSSSGRHYEWRSNVGYSQRSWTGSREGKVQATRKLEGIETQNWRKGESVPSTFKKFTEKGECSVLSNLLNSKRKLCRNRPGDDFRRYLKELKAEGNARWKYALREEECWKRGESISRERSSRTSSKRPNKQLVSWRLRKRHSRRKAEDWDDRRDVTRRDVTWRKIEK